MISVFFLLDNQKQDQFVNLFRILARETTMQRWCKSEKIVHWTTRKTSFVRNNLPPLSVPLFSTAISERQSFIKNTLRRSQMCYVSMKNTNFLWKMGNKASSEIDLQTMLSFSGCCNYIFYPKKLTTLKIWPCDHSRWTSWRPKWRHSSCPATKAHIVIVVMTLFIVYPGFIADRRVLAIFDISVVFCNCWKCWVTLSALEGSWVTKIVISLRNPKKSPKLVRMAWTAQWHALEQVSFR